MTCVTETRSDVGHPIHRLAASLTQRLREKRRRRAMRRLIDYDNQMLEDIGVTRGEIWAATSLPASADAATELRRMSLERRRRRL